jgi:transposase
MIHWSRPVIDREQIPLFAPTLDAFLDGDHSVRVVAEILNGLDFSAWEQEYDGMIGQPPIHPRMMAGALLYGMSLGIRSSRRLEDACVNRLDFIWLLEGRHIDHSTFCQFRVKHHQHLKELFRQLVLTGRAMGMTRLNQVIWDGTRIKANNSHQNTARQDKLEKLIKELDEQFERMTQESQQADERENALYGEEGGGKPLPRALADKAKRLDAMKQALATVREMRQRQTKKEESEKPKGPAVAFTDPDARILPNKEGGFAPNYTPVAAIDGESGLALDGQVIVGRCEDQALIPSLERIEETLGQLPKQALADSAYHTADNVGQLERNQVEALIPERLTFQQNPARRANPSEPVPPEQWTGLPINPSSKTLDKAAFIYDKNSDCYHCPLGKPLAYLTSRRYLQNGKLRMYRIYECQSCAACPLRSRCLTGKTQQRTIYRQKEDSAREAASERLRSESGQQAYSRRPWVEGMIGTIKSVLGVRQFLLRGASKVGMEWLWILSAYNLRLLMARKRAVLAGG